MQHSQQKRNGWVLYKAIFWSVVPPAIFMAGYFAHNGWLMLLGLLSFAGLAVETSSWSHKTRSLVGALVAAVAGPFGLYLGIRNADWWKGIIGAGMCYIAIYHFHLVWQNRKLRRQ